MKDILIYTIKILSKHKSDDFLASRFKGYFKLHTSMHKPHKNFFYQLLMFTEGVGSHEIDFVKFDVKPYQIYFMTPGQMHRWSFETPADGYVINFSLSFLQSFLLKSDYLEQIPFFRNAESPVIELPENCEPNVQVIFEQILKESESPGMLSFDFIKALLVQLFIIIGRLELKSPAMHITSHKWNLIKKFLKLLEKNVCQLKLPKDYADLLFMTSSHLNSLCNNVLGKSTGEIIRDRIILEAKRLIVNPDLPISEISYKLNFRDNSYFSKFFKRHTGLTPEEFRNLEKYPDELPVSPISKRRISLRL